LYTWFIYVHRQIILKKTTIWIHIYTFAKLLVFRFDVGHEKLYSTGYLREEIIRIPLSSLQNHYFHMYVYMLLCVVKIFGSKKHIFNTSFQLYVLRKGKYCANFLTKLRHSLRPCVTLWKIHSLKLEIVLRLVSQIELCS